MTCVVCPNRRKNAWRMRRGSKKPVSSAMWLIRFPKKSPKTGPARFLYSPACYGRPMSAHLQRPSGGPPQIPETGNLLDVEYYRSGSAGSLELGIYFTFVPAFFARHLTSPKKMCKTKKRTQSVNHEPSTWTMQPAPRSHHSSLITAARLLPKIFF